MRREGKQETLNDEKKLGLSDLVCLTTLVMSGATLTLFVWLPGIGLRSVVRLMLSSDADSGVVLSGMVRPLPWMLLVIGATASLTVVVGSILWRTRSFRPAWILTLPWILGTCIAIGGLNVFV